MIKFKLGVWLLRGWKVFVAGLFTCGLAWVWIAMYLYYEWFRRHRSPQGQAFRAKTATNPFTGRANSVIRQSLSPALNRAQRRRRLRGRRRPPWL